jgi:hypothetical protein
MNPDNLKPGCVYKVFNNDYAIFLEMTNDGFCGEKRYHFFSLKNKRKFVRISIVVKKRVEEL